VKDVPVRVDVELRGRRSECQALDRLIDAAGLTTVGSFRNQSCTRRIAHQFSVQLSSLCRIDPQDGSRGAGADLRWGITPLGVSSGQRCTHPGGRWGRTKPPIATVVGGAAQRPHVTRHNQTRHLPKARNLIGETVWYGCNDG
jgi:hypothetical protein